MSASDRSADLARALRRLADRYLADARIPRCRAERRELRDAAAAAREYAAELEQFPDRAAEASPAPLSTPRVPASSQAAR